MPAQLPQNPAKIIKLNNKVTASYTVAIGNFDGIHLGHKKILEYTKKLADYNNNSFAAITFEPHPIDFFAKKKNLFHLTSLEAKKNILKKIGCDAIIVLKFDQSLSSLNAHDFIQKILIKKFNVKAIVIGENFYFGKDRNYSAYNLKEISQQYKIDVHIIKNVNIESLPISSTYIRGLLENGNVKLAAKLLGHNYFVIGKVIEGKKHGRKIGYPTANLQLPNDVKLCHGVYAVKVILDNKSYLAAASFGRQPSIEKTITYNNQEFLEVYIFDFDKNIYNKTIEVHFLDWVSAQEKFTDVNTLTKKIAKDIIYIKKNFNNLLGAK